MSEYETIRQNGTRFHIDPYSHGSANGVPLGPIMFPSVEYLERHISEWHTQKRWREEDRL